MTVTAIVVLSPKALGEDASEMRAKGEGKDGGEDGEESPWELQEREVGEMAPDGCGDGGRGGTR